MVEGDEPATRIDHHAYGVEAELRRVRPVAHVREIRERHSAHLGLLRRPERVERAGVPRCTTCLDLGEDEDISAAGHDVQLAEPGAVVARDDLVTEADEVIGRELLAGGAESASEVW